MSADFGMIEAITSLFLAGMFGVTGYFLGFSIALRGHAWMLLGLAVLSAVLWTWVVFGMEHAHVLAASKAALVADATIWPFCFGALAGHFILQRQPRQKRVDEMSS